MAKKSSPNSWKFVVIDGNGDGVMQFEGRPTVDIPDDWKILEVPEQANIGGYTTDIEKWHSL